MLEIGMNHARTFWSFHAFFECPSAHFLLASGEVRGQPEQVIARTYKKRNARVANAKRL